MKDKGLNSNVYRPWWTNTAQPFVCSHCGRRASDPVAVEPPPAVPLVVPQAAAVPADGPQVKPVEISKPKKSRAVANKN